MTAQRHPPDLSLALPPPGQGAGESMFAVKSGARELLRMYPKKELMNSSTTEYFDTHQLAFQGSATFGNVVHNADKNITIQSSERATLSIVTGDASDASVEATSGQGKSAVLNMQNTVGGSTRTFAFSTSENTVYGTGVFSIETASTLLTLEELSAAQGGVPGASHILTITGTVESLTALVVSSDVTIGDSRCQPHCLPPCVPTAFVWRRQRLSSAFPLPSCS